MELLACEARGAGLRQTAGGGAAAHRAEGLCRSLLRRASDGGSSRLHGPFALAVRTRNRVLLFSETGRLQLSRGGFWQVPDAAGVAFHLVGPVVPRLDPGL